MQDIQDGMRLSTTMRYGARAVVQIAAASPSRAVSVCEISEKQGISRKYLEHILRTLKAAGLVQSVRGTSGGYRLARNPEQITLKDLFVCLVGSTAPVDCVDSPDKCCEHEICAMRDTWTQLRESIEGILERTTIQALLDRQASKASVTANMYYI
jgi:Rrf2 family protein